MGEFRFLAKATENGYRTSWTKLIKNLPELVNVAPSTEADHRGGDGAESSTDVKKHHGTLASFLTAKKANSNKTRKFLAAALWLQDGGKKRLKTGDVTKALDDNNQGKVGNASRCLNDNVRQGFCVKDGKQFYVTPEGRTEIK